MSFYFPNGPDVWRVGYGYQFEQFENLKKALNYMEDKLKKNHRHILTIQKLNLKKVELGTPEFKIEVDKLGR